MEFEHILNLTLKSLGVIALALVIFLILMMIFSTIFLTSASAYQV